MLDLATLGVFYNKQVVTLLGQGTQIFSTCVLRNLLNQNRHPEGTRTLDLQALVHEPLSTKDRHTSFHILFANSV